jgi:hypothetical protein
MKNENSRLGRCNACRYWKSATDLLAERTSPTSSANEVENARRAIRAELSLDLLKVDHADERGWCTAAETGATGPSELLAINIMTAEPARMITASDYGCINQQPRPRRAMNAPPPDFSRNPRLGRCGGCRFWSSADNEAQTLLNMARYTNANARIDESEQEAYARLSPPPLKLETAGTRGWCKAASDTSKETTRNLAVDPSSGSVGALITGETYACMRFMDMIDPRLKTTPSWRWMINRNKIHNLGYSTPINELLWSYLEPGTLLDPNHPLSPLHPEHPLNIRNPRSLYYNPNPAFAAYIANPTLIQTVIDPNSFQAESPPPKSEGPTASTKMRLNLPFSTASNIEADTTRRTVLAQAKLAQDFAQRTLKDGLPRPEGDMPAKPAVLLAKPGDKIGYERRNKQRSDVFVRRKD